MESFDVKGKDSLEGYIKESGTGKLIPNYDETIKIFNEGDVVAGTVVKVDRDEVLVDIGYKSEGVIPVRELSVKTNVKPQEIIKVGDEIEALVLQKEDAEGRLILSKKRADFEKAWDKVAEAADAKTAVEGEVIEVVKGGLILDIGLRGFLPASLIDLSRVTDLNQFVGQTLECKIIELDKRRNNVVLSRRAVLEISKSEERQKILAKLEKGQILSGTISNLASFGAFVDLGGIDGLIHISELSWSRVSHPSEVVKVGEKVKVQILDIDEEKERVSLGLKQTQEDPWRAEVSKLSAGSVIEGKVTRLVPFGAFVQINPELEALVHISELSSQRIDQPEQVVNVDDTVKAKVIEIDLEKRRISLSIKQLEEPKTEEETEAVEKEPKKKVEEKLVEKPEEKVEEKLTKEAEEKPKEEVKEEVVVKEPKVEEPKKVSEIKEETKKVKEAKEVEEVKKEVEEVKKETKKTKEVETPQLVEVEGKKEIEEAKEVEETPKEEAEEETKEAKAPQAAEVKETEDEAKEAEEEAKEAKEAKEVKEIPQEEAESEEEKAEEESPAEPGSLEAILKAMKKKRYGEDE